MEIFDLVMSLIGASGGVLGGVTGVLAFRRTSRAQEEQRARQAAKLEVTFITVVSGGKSSSS